MKRIVVSRFSAMLLLLAGTGRASSQTRGPSFQYVVTAAGDLSGSSTTYTAHRGSRQLVYFANDKLTIAATIEVEDIDGGVARLKVIAQSYPGKVDRETSKGELKSALEREYTYVPLEKLSMPVDRGGVLSLEGAIADEAGNLAKPLAQHSMETEPGQILLLSPALFEGDRVLCNLKMGAGTGPGLNGNPAVALYAPPEGLFLFALQAFEGASACEVIHGRAECRVEGSVYTLFSRRPITGGNEESKIWVLRVPGYLPSKVGVSWRDGEGSIRAGSLRDLFAELRVEESTLRH